jgi:hypothetical protein
MIEFVLMFCAFLIFIRLYMNKFYIKEKDKYSIIIAVIITSVLSIIQFVLDFILNLILRIKFIYRKV